MIKNLIHSWWFYKLLIGADFSKIIVSKVGGGEKKTKHNNLINVPLYSSHPLPKAVLLLCKAVQMSLSPLKGEGAIACLSYCDRGSSYLCSSISVPLAQSGNWLNKVGYRQFQKDVPNMAPTLIHAVHADIKESSIYYKLLSHSAALTVVKA